MKLRLRSFRARIVLVSLGVVTLILALVSAISWTSAMSYEVHRLDGRLCEEAQRFASQPHPAGLGRFENDVSRKLRLQSAEQVLLWLQPGLGPDIRSTRWPQGLDPNAWIWTAVADRKQPGRTADAPPGQGGDFDRPPRTQNPRAGARRDLAEPSPDDLAPPNDTAQVPGPPRGPPWSPCEVAVFGVMGSDWRAAKVVTPGATSVVAADLAGVLGELRKALASIAWRATPPALLLTALGAWLISALAMGPVARLQGTLEGVNQQSLEQRLPTGHEDLEFKAMIDAYNRMLERLQTSFQQAMRFSADAAHELRTPLTVLQGQIEHAMRLSGDLPIQVQLSQMLDEASRLSAITRKLLLLSQADAGKLALLRTRVDLGAMLRDLLAEARAELHDVTIASNFQGSSVVQADLQLMGQLLNNLCGNACRYTPAGGWITLQAHALDSGVQVMWSNSTLVIAPHDRERFFDRFYRGDAAHNRRVDGHGLGLSLSRVIARAHGGDLTLEDGPLDEVRLRLWLPRA